MDQGPLVAEQIAAGARFLSEFNKYRPVQTAFWLKESDTGQRYLWVASEQITDENFDVAYGEAIEISRKLPDPWFDADQVKVIGADDPLAKFVRDLWSQRPGRTYWYLDGQTVNWVSIEDLYIYPTPILAPA